MFYRYDASAKFRALPIVFFYCGHVLINLFLKYEFGANISVLHGRKYFKFPAQF